MATRRLISRFEIEMESGVKFRDLNAQYNHIKDKIDSAIMDTINSGTFIGGSPASELEQKLAEYVGVKHCVSCANGTDALQLALMAWDIGPGDAVFVPDFTFFSSAEVVPCVGATPVFVDVRKDTFNMDPDSLEKEIKRISSEGKLRPKVIVAVDLFGQPAEHDRIRKIADEYDMYVLEDAAQGFGGSINGRLACSFGDISTTSFFPAKPLGCYGDGGAVFTDNDEWANLIRSFKVHGKGSDKYDNIRIGMNSRLDTIQAAILLAKFDNFKDMEIDSCNRVAEKYTELLNGCVITPTILDGMASSWAQYSILLKDTEERTRVENALKEKGIPTAVYYIKPLHMQTAFKDSTQYGSEDICPDTVDICKRVLSLPMHPYLSDEEIRMITGIIKETCK